MTKDSTNKMPIINCELLIEQMSEKSCYNMTNMQVQRYLDEGILKTTLQKYLLTMTLRYQQMMMMFTFIPME